MGRARKTCRHCGEPIILSNHATKGAGPCWNKEGTTGNRCPGQPNGHQPSNAVTPRNRRSLGLGTAIDPEGASTP